jgi:hypothetical protein
VVMEPSAIVASVWLDRWPADLPVDATVSGEPLPLYLWLWGRGPREPLTLDGDLGAVDDMDARLRLATQ